MQNKMINQGYLVRCDIGEDLVRVLTKFAGDNNIGSGSVTGLGAVKDPVLGYFDLDQKVYLKKKLSGNFELLNLTGNFSRLGSDVILHCHAIVSDVELNVFGGHLFEGVIAVTGEFHVYPGGIVVNRGADETTGLNLIKL